MSDRSLANTGKTWELPVSTGVFRFERRSADADVAGSSLSVPLSLAVIAFGQLEGKALWMYPSARKCVNLQRRSRLESSSVMLDRHSSSVPLDFHGVPLCLAVPPPPR